MTNGEALIQLLNDPNTIKLLGNAIEILREVEHRAFKSPVYYLACDISDHADALGRLQVSLSDYMSEEKLNV